jgi:RNA polymerase sigma factor (TIGR02999 family)
MAMFLFCAPEKWLGECGELLVQSVAEATARAQASAVTGVTESSDPQASAPSGDWSYSANHNPKTGSGGGHARPFFVFLRKEPGRPRERFPQIAEDAPMMPDSTDPPLNATPAAELLPTLYAELRRLAASLTARLPLGQTLQPTALVHEAYLKLVRRDNAGWEGKRHFFGAAAQAMRDILVDQARRKASLKHGGHGQRVELTDGLAWIEPPADDVLALDEAIQRLQAEEPRLAEIVLLRYYTGLSVEETAAVVGRSESTVKREWRQARAWLAGRLQLREEAASAPPRPGGSLEETRE